MTKIKNYFLLILTVVITDHFRKKLIHILFLYYGIFIVSIKKKMGGHTLEVFSDTADYTY